MNTGQTAINKMVCHHPDAHKYFDKTPRQFKTVDHFAVVISAEDWRVYEHSGCWLMAQRTGMFIWEVHWFCPHHANVRAMRLMLDTLFNETQALAVYGRVPPGHPNERAARTVNVALGGCFGERILPFDKGPTRHI